jgi:3-hydroxybutyryl-CoA dehydrogenase
LTLARGSDSLSAMQIDDIRRVSVVGAGQMGAGIAEVCARIGLEVSLSDQSREHAERGLESIEKSLAGAVRRDLLSAADKAGTLSRIAASDRSPRDVDLVIEAASENVTLKLELFARLERETRPGALLCSNTSSISLTRIAAVTERAPLVVGMHFMNPVPRMQLVEVVRGLATSEETLRLVLELSRRLGKTPIVSQDRPGFIVNRMLIPLLNEACFTLQEGIASVSDIDAGAELGLNHPMGPLRLADLIGLDTVLAIADVLRGDFGDDKYRAPALLKNLVSAGWLGRKTRRGFYLYDEAGKPVGANPALRP